METTKSRTDKCEKLPELDSFVKYVGGAFKFSIPKQPIDFEKKVEWLFRQCSKNLAIAQKVLGKNIVEEILKYGGSKFDLLDESLIAAKKKLINHG